jgi:hypothetical protein
MTTWIYDFSEGSRYMRELLGGKGDAPSGLVEEAAAAVLTQPHRPVLLKQLTVSRSGRWQRACAQCVC